MNNNSITINRDPGMGGTEYLGIKRNELLKYVRTLDHDTEKLFYAADRIVVESVDTLSDEFQIAADVVDLFINRAKQYQEQTG